MIKSAPMMVGVGEETGRMPWLVRRYRYLWSQGGGASDLQRPQQDRDKLTPRIAPATTRRDRRRSEHRHTRRAAVAGPSRWPWSHWYQRRGIQPGRHPVAQPLGDKAAAGKASTQVR